MGTHSCVGSTSSDDSKFSSPIPLIGLYVAGATLVCLLLMTLDMFAGFRDRKRWLPCRLFPLNALSLALVGVAIKLPLDLTTLMPSVQDQLSKLTGTAFICIYMGFVMPSTNSECISNMLALSIIVIPVVVNICIQMHTGLINSFQKEHVIVLCCMMLLLALLWSEALLSVREKGCTTGYIKHHFMNGQGSLLHRLKGCFLHSYNANPQLQLCREEISAVTCALCITCTVVLQRVIFRSFVSKELEFCEDTSDYRWSMWFIVFSQTITILAGCLGISIRFFSMAKHLQTKLMSCGPIWCENGFIKVVMFPVTTLYYLVVSLFELATFCYFSLSKVASLLVNESMKCFREARESNGRSCFNMCKPENDSVEVSEYRSLTPGEMYYLEDWILKKGGQDMNRWLKMSMTKVPNHLIQLLHETPPSRESLTTLLRNQHEICSMSLVVVAGIATRSIPSSRSQCIFDSLSEVFEILYYIDQRIPSVKTESITAKILWTGKKFYTIFQEPKSEVVTQAQMPRDQAIETIKSVKDNLFDFANYSISQELNMIIGFIRRRTYRSMEEIHRDLEQLFVDMLNECLIQLPGIIVKEINESPPEDFEKRLKEAIKAVSQIQQLEGLVQWSFPVGTTFTSMVTEASMVGGDASAVESNNNNAITIGGASSGGTNIWINWREGINSIVSEDEITQIV